MWMKQRKTIEINCQEILHTILFICSLIVAQLSYVCVQQQSNIFNDKAFDIINCLKVLKALNNMYII